MQDPSDSLKNPLIAIIGAGAVGGYYGARLTQHGYDVHLLTRGDCRQIRSHGMRIESRDGDFILHPDQVYVYDDPRAMPRADLVIVTLKTTANAYLADLVGPVLKPESIILTLQNGLGNEEKLGKLFGLDRVLGGMAFVCLNRIAPGQIVHSDHGLVRVGEVQGGLSARAQRIAEIFSSSGVPCQAIENLTWGKWDKLIWNVPFNGLGALLQLSTDHLIGCPSGLKLIRTLMGEVIDASRAMGVVIPEDTIEAKIRHTRSMGAYKTSMQLDRENKRPLEVESILGEPVRSARANNVSTPEMEMLYDMLLLAQFR